MKKIFLTLFIFSACVAGFYGCKKLDKLTQFYLTYNTSVTVPANTVINLPISLFTPEMTTNYEEQFKANDTRADKVEEIKIDNITMKISAPAGANFDFLKSITVYISAEGLDEKEVASATNIPDGLTELQLDHTNDNLKDYITKPAIKFRVRTESDKAISQDVHIDVVTRLWVNAKILGV